MGCVPSQQDKNYRQLPPLKPGEIYMTRAEFEKTLREAARQGFLDELRMRRGVPANSFHQSPANSFHRDPANSLDLSLNPGLNDQQETGDFGAELNPAVRQALEKLSPIERRERTRVLQLQIKQVYISTWYRLIIRSEIFYDFRFKEKHPLSFLSSRLSQFTKATRIFTTREFYHSNVAAEFHQACDNIPNTLVIIKSGQYIAGGYTEVAWKPSPEMAHSARSFVFSVNRVQVYGPLRFPEGPECVVKNKGPCFRNRRGFAICVHDSYKDMGNHSQLDYDGYVGCSELEDPLPNTALFGSQFFAIDEYEVYKLE